MSTSIFKQWLQDFDKKVGSEKQKILLFLDNAPVHLKVVKELHDCGGLSNMNIELFPEKITSKLQIADAGWIQAIKLNCRNLLLNLIVGLTIPTLDDVASIDFEY